MKLCVIALLFWGGPEGHTQSAKPKSSQEPLTLEALAQAKQGDCTLIKPWAAWCLSCVQGLPDFFEVFSDWEKGPPWVVDLSSPGVQKGFSQPWLDTLSPPWTTRAKPASVGLSSYNQAIDPDWDGALPYAVLYRKGLKIQTWRGTNPATELKKSIKGLCL